MRPEAKVRPSTQLGRSASCWRTSGSASARRRVDGHVPAPAAGRRQDARDRRRPRPDEQRRGARAARTKHLRGKVGRVGRQADLRGDGLGVRAERLGERLAALVAVAAVVGQERHTQAFRDEVLGEAEGDAPVGRRDAEHVRTLLDVHEAHPALVGDAQGDVGVPGDDPGGVDAGPLVDDRDGAVGDGGPDVRDRLARRERVVEALDADPDGAVGRAEGAGDAPRRARRRARWSRPRTASWRTAR